MRPNILLALTSLLLAPIAHAEVGVGHPFPGLASECTPAVPGVACDNPDSLGVGRVEMYSGEYFLEEDDLRIPGRGFDFLMRRTYRSRGERNVGDNYRTEWKKPRSAMGPGWDFSYNIWLESHLQDQLLGCCEDADPSSGIVTPCGESVSAIRVHMGNGRTQMLSRSVSRTFTDTNGDGMRDGPCPPTWDGGYTVGDFLGPDLGMKIIETQPDSRTAPTDLGGFLLEFGDGSRWHFKTFVRTPRPFCSWCVPQFPENTKFFQDTFKAVCDWIEDANGNRMHLRYARPEPWDQWGHASDDPRLIVASPRFKLTL